jgi:hypothetical protein
MVKLRSYHVYMFVVLVERVQFKSFFFIKGLDPLTTTSMFASAWCIGKRKVIGENCFILNLCADLETLRARTEELA